MPNPINLFIDIQAELKVQPKKRRTVLIGCMDDINTIIATMEKAGVHTSSQMPELGILSATLNYEDFLKIQNISGIEWIEFDEEVQTLVDQ